MNQLGNSLETRQNNKAAIFSLQIRFKAGLALLKYFEAIFRTVPIHRFNGFYFYGDENQSNGATEYIVLIAGENQALLEAIRKVLKNAPEFLQLLSSENMVMEKFSLRSAPLAKIANNRVKTTRKYPPVVLEGAASAKEKKRFVSSAAFLSEPCKRCGHDADGLSFCPNCGRQQRRLRGLTLVYLIAMFAYTILRFMSDFDPSWLSALHPFVWIMLGITAIQILGMLLGITLLILYRKAGFWLLVALKSADVILYVVVMGSIDFYVVFAALFGSLVFIFLLYTMLRKDLPHMK